MADISTGVGLAVAVASALTLNWAYVQEHDAASKLPPLSLKHPVKTVKLLISSREWLRGVAGETSGFALYVVALALAPLSLVQSVSAGGIAVLAYVAIHRQKRPPTKRERAGVSICLVGLIALAVSLAGSTTEGHDTSFVLLALWLAGSYVIVLSALAASRRWGQGVPYAIAAGTLLASGDISMKFAFEGGEHFLFLGTAIIGYAVGTILLQIAYQHAQALTAAGIATLLTNAIPIVAATAILGEQVPSGILGVLRVVAFVAIIGGAVALARDETPEAKAEVAEVSAERAA
jgi:hypothetical protein